MANTTFGRTGAETRVPKAAEVARWLPLGAVAGPVIFTIAWLALGFVSRGYTAWGTYVPYSPVHQGVSGLGLGVSGPYMNAAFLINGVLSLIGVVAICQTVPGLTGAARWTCTVLLAMPSVGSMIDGVFTLESFMPHFFGFGLVLGTIVGFPVTGFQLRRLGRWHRFGTWLIVAGPLTLVLAALYFATFSPTIAGTEAGIAGLTERLLIVEVQGCFVALAWLAMRSRRATVQPAVLAKRDAAVA